jgi:hypothetical protein
MFNALEDMSDFIEITNTSNTPLQLQGLKSLDGIAQLVKGHNAE